MVEGGAEGPGPNRPSSRVVASSRGETAGRGAAIKGHKAGWRGLEEEPRGAAARGPGRARTPARGAHASGLPGTEAGAPEPTVARAMDTPCCKVAGTKPAATGGPPRRARAPKAEGTEVKGLAPSTAGEEEEGGPAAARGGGAVACAAKATDCTPGGVAPIATGSGNGEAAAARGGAARGKAAGAPSLSAVAGGETSEGAAGRPTATEDAAGPTGAAWPAE